eukprot:CAMPEP_0201578468 /NCGR_PEP_ID=MMETSP0190_2-20130828/25351_1 /ASSEMBLY_ACC=CAM_ASM_000263 /TAXON_ID=37353 /ORGANISM="Rosalina sp." /LENGTH=101 /DNA_ID=CAMNT_0048011683 /DNA_START=23 /DNA_END=328 /DNA_ORIENTATION=-
MPSFLMRGKGGIERVNSRTDRTKSAGASIATETSKTTTIKTKEATNISEVASTPQPAIPEGTPQLPSMITTDSTQASGSPPQRSSNNMDGIEIVCDDTPHS